MFGIRLPAIVIWGLWVIGIPLFCCASAPSDAVKLKVSPKRIVIGPFYHGAEIDVEATLPLDLDVVLVCTGPEEKLDLKKKGKVWDLLWLNVGDVTFEHVPCLYALLSSRSLSDIASRETLERNDLGYDALSRHVSSDLKTEDREFLFRELVKLKERDGLFRIEAGTLRVESDKVEHVVAKFRIPPKAPPDVYTVRLLGLRQGSVKIQCEESLVLESVGFVAYISSVAENHGLAYGCVAVFLALCAGLLTGWIFGLRSGKSH